MEINELDLHLWAEHGAPRAMLRDAIEIGGPVQASRWQTRPDVDLKAALGELARHAGPVRVTVPIERATDSRFAFVVDEALARRPDALRVHRPGGFPRFLAPRLDVPLRIGRIGAAPAPAAPFLVDQPRALAALRGEPPHVLHAGVDAEFAPLADELSRARSLPLLVVLEVLSATGPATGSDLALQRLGVLAALGCRAAIAIVGVTRDDLIEASDAFYRGLRRDRELDGLVRDLAPPHSLLLMLADDAQRAVSLRRALIDRPRRNGRSLAQWSEAPRPSRAPATELEAMIASRTRDAARRVARARDAIAATAPSSDPATENALLVANQEADAAVAAAAELSGMLAQTSSSEWPKPPPEIGPVTRGFDGVLESYDPFAPISRQPGVRGEPIAMPRRALSTEVVDDRGTLRHGVVIGQPFWLEVAIRFPDRHRRGHEMPIPQALLDRAFGDASSIDVDLVVWTRPEEFAVECPTPRLALPRMGESGTATFTITPSGTAGERRLRVTAYHRNCLLQSLTLDITVATDLDTARRAASPQIVLDYVLSDELLTIDENAERRVSIFVNQGAGGTHLLGVRTATHAAAHGATLDLPLDEARSAADRVRLALRTASELDAGDRYAQPHARTTPLDRGLREQQIVALAQAGNDLYTTLFAAGVDDGIGDLRAALSAPDGHIEIARCQNSAPNLPWQLTYDFPVALSDPPPQLCKLYREQVERGQDLLDRPASCASQTGCAHRDRLIPGEPADPGAPSPEHTVCPFGFWGVRHRIAQPLAMRDGNRAGRSAPPCGERGATVGYYAFADAETHIRRVAPAGTAGFTVTRNVDELRGLLRDRRDAVVYLYCHGKVVDRRFVLQVGTEQDSPAQYLTVNALALTPRWTHGPIVILNGCETLRVQPETAHNVLGVLRNCGAAAIVGPEIEMFTTSAAAIGERIVAGILAGEPLDAIMVSIRRALLRDMSPMGLAYNVYAPSGLCWKPPDPVA